MYKEHPPQPSSQEVFRSGFLGGFGDTAGLLRSCLEDLVELCEVLIELEDRSHVTASIAVVWCRPYGDECFVKHFFVAFHHKLMSSRNQFRAIFLIKDFAAVLTKDVASASW